MSKVILIDMKNEQGSRKLEARLEASGDLIFDGWDLNRHPVMDIEEYEWTWTIESKDVDNFYKALKTDLPLLEAVKERFDAAWSLPIKEFLTTNNIPSKVWSWRS